MKLKFKSTTLLVEVSYSSVTLVMTISSTPFLSTLGEYLKKGSEKLPIGKFFSLNPQYV